MFYALFEVFFLGRPSYFSYAVRAQDSKNLITYVIWSNTYGT